MASLAELQRFLRQRRAVGQTTSGAEKRAAFEAFFDAEANKNLQRSSLALQSRGLDISEKQGAASLALSREQFASDAEFKRAQLDAEEDAAKVKGVTELGQLAFLGSKTKLGGKAISGVKSLFSSTPPVSGSVAGTGTGPFAAPVAGGAQAATTQAVTSLAPTATSGSVAGTGAGPFTAPATATAAPAGGLGAAGIGGGIAAVAAADDILSRKIAGTEDDPEAGFAQKTRGITRFGGASPLQTALIEKGLGKSGRKIVDKVTDPFGVLGKVEDKIGSVISKTIPKFLGGGK